MRSLLHFEPAMIQPFTLCVFVADDDPLGRRIVHKSNWIGRALASPRALPLQQVMQTKVSLVED